MYLLSAHDIRFDAHGANYTERQKKHHFCRAMLTKIHAVKINNIWTQISFNTS